jgi:imidazolonepropionase-like amidohydrolase
MDGYLEEIVSDEVRNRMDRGAQVPLREMLESVVGRKMRAMAAHTRSSDTWIVPTLHLWEDLYRPMDLDSASTSSEMRFVPSSELDYWIAQKAARPAVDPETASLLGTVRGRLLRALTMAGVGCLMGTGAPQMFQVPGFSLRHELRRMEAAGLTPYEILVTGTRNVAEYARDELLEPGNFGQVAEGNRADLILLRDNPFQDLEALWDQEGVMVRGRWIPREEIDARLERIASSR